MSSANGVQQVWGGCSCWLSMPEVEEGADRWPHLWAALEREGGVTDFAGQGRGKRAERTGPGEREGGRGGKGRRMDGKQTCAENGTRTRRRF